jgi:hypothetical protein
LHVYAYINLRSGGGSGVMVLPKRIASFRGFQKGNLKGKRRAGGLEKSHIEPLFHSIGVESTVS